jgi:hypothetical protein
MYGSNYYGGADYGDTRWTTSGIIPPVITIVKKIVQKSVLLIKNMGGTILNNGDQKISVATTRDGASLLTKGNINSSNLSTKNDIINV